MESQRLDTVENVLTLFEKETQKWFQDTLGEPTLVQKEAWPGIKAGRHVLVSAPTGTERHFLRSLFSGPDEAAG